MPTPALSRARRLRRRDAAASLVVGVVAWEAVARLLDQPLIFAGPSMMLRATAFLEEEGGIYVHLWTTGVEFVLGYLLGVLAGLAVGFALALWPRGRPYAQPWVTIAYNAPVVTLAPLFVIMFGVGIWSKLVVTMIGAVFPPLFNAYVGLTTTPENLREAVRSLGATRRQELRAVILPWALPLIMTGLRLAVGRALVGAVVSELFGATAGIGHLIVAASQEFETPLAFFGITILGATGWITYEALRLLERKLAPWYQG